jgi:hypothetical protein
MERNIITLSLPIQPKKDEKRHEEKIPSPIYNTFSRSNINQPLYIKHKISFR